MNFSTWVSHNRCGLTQRHRHSHPPSHRKQASSSSRKKYMGEEEVSLRRGIFETNAATVDAHNARYLRREVSFALGK